MEETQNHRLDLKEIQQQGWLRSRTGFPRLFNSLLSFSTVRMNQGQKGLDELILLRLMAVSLSPGLSIAVTIFITAYWLNYRTKLKRKLLHLVY